MATWAFLQFSSTVIPKKNFVVKYLVCLLNEFHCFIFSSNIVSTFVAEGHRIAGSVSI